MIPIILTSWILFAQSMFGNGELGAYCYEEIATGIYAPCAIKTGEWGPDEFGNMQDIWEFGTEENKITWYGPPFCIEGWFPSAPEAYGIGACTLVENRPNAPSGLEVS